MNRKSASFLVLAFLLVLAPGSFARQMKILTNHLGYEMNGPKHAVVMGRQGDRVSSCSLKDERTDQTTLSLDPKDRGPVQKWRDWYFWTLDFDSFAEEGEYLIECATSMGDVRSFSFHAQKHLLERGTVSDVIYYFKDERSSGQMDKADRHLHFQGGKKSGTVDAHGGWWDATGDYGKHLSHLLFSTYFNPQQIPLVVYSLLKSYEQANRRELQGFARYKARLLDEAMFGADYLVRVKVPNGSFYRSVSNGGVDQVPEKREIQGEMKRFGIETAPGKRPGMIESASNDLEYEVSYRSGGGIAIAALAMASTFPVSGQFRSSDYLKAAEDAFDFLENNNRKLINDGKENIVDDYCALAAATELFRATHLEKYKQAADRRATALMARQISAGGYRNYWQADDGTRPFFHASDGGFPAVSLLYYAQVVDPAVKDRVLQVVRQSLEFEFAITSEVANPFGYSREYVQDKTGARRTSFFFPHNSDAAPWWQGENARLASMAAAARLAELAFPQDAAFRKRLEAFAADQLNWILGLNPFDSCMLNGVGRNNPPYMYFDSWEFTNAPGGISNGITAGFKDENDIDYLLTYKQTGADNDWRWGEQWLPHAAWYLLATTMGGDAGRD